MLDRVERGLLAICVVLAVPARSIPDPQQVWQGSVSQHLYLQQHQDTHSQDAEHSADEEGQREERQECHQEGQCCQILQDWREIPRQSRVDRKLIENFSKLTIWLHIFVSGPLCLCRHWLCSFPNHPVCVGRISLDVPTTCPERTNNSGWSYFSVA